MKICSTCNKELNDDDLYCPACGAKYEEKSSDEKSSNELLETSEIEGDNRPRVSIKPIILAGVTLLVFVFGYFFSYFGLGIAVFYKTIGVSFFIAGFVIKLASVIPAVIAFRSGDVNINARHGKGFYIGVKVASIVLMVLVGLSVIVFVIILVNLNVLIELVRQYLPPEVFEYVGE